VPVFRWLARTFFGARRALRGGPAHAEAPAITPGPATDPWVAALLAELGERYRLGGETPDGQQLLCRQSRARFNPMRVWVRSADRAVLGDYDVRVHGGKSLDDGRTLLDREVGAALGALGLKPAGESVEAWAGQVITRRYQGAGLEPRAAAAAVHFMCQESSPALDVDAE
jgi:hypothetical protein